MILKYGSLALLLSRFKLIATGFEPAISNKAAKAIRQEIRGWELQKKSDKSLDDLASVGAD